MYVYWKKFNNIWPSLSPFTLLSIHHCLLPSLCFQPSLTSAISDSSHLCHQPSLTSVIYDFSHLWLQPTLTPAISVSGHLWLQSSLTPVISVFRHIWLQSSFFSAVVSFHCTIIFWVGHSSVHRPYCSNFVQVPGTSRLTSQLGCPGGQPR